ncbi:MAG: hypothetical protein AABX29_00150 [Nanoarchaeota archaeon]
MFKKGQIVNLKNIFIISLVLIAIFAVVLFFNNPTGFVWGIDSANAETQSTTGNSEDLDLISVGDQVIGVFRDDIGTLAISKPDIYNRIYFVRIENSQTSYEQDYGTEVVIEADRDSIRYTLNGNPLSKNSFTLMSQKFAIGKIVSSTSLYLNGKLVKDGDAFVSENLDDPNWVWDLERLTSNNPVIGIENDFVMNDPSDTPSPPKVGECIYLPYNYASICLDKLVTVDGKVKAKVSVKFKGQSTTGTGALTQSQKKEVLEMLRNCGYNYIHGKDVKRIFNKDFATGDDLCKGSGSDKICVMVGTRYPDTDYGDTYYGGMGCDDPIVHSNSQFMGLAICCSAK